MLQCGPADRCAALALRALAGGELIAVDESFLVISAMAVLIAADREEAMTMWDTLRAAAHRRGSLFSALAVNLWSGFTLSRRGDLTGAEPLIRQAAGEMQVWGVLGPVGLSYAWGMLAEVLAERGDLPGAQAVLADAPPTGGPSEGEKPPPARSRQVRAGRRRHGRCPGGGRGPRAPQPVQPQPGLVQLAVRARAGPEPGRLEYARALAALGSALRRSRQPGAAREPLRQALHLAATCGADALAQHALAELHAAGVRPRTEAAHGVDSLTPSERRVAALAADGAANKDIAQALYVTPKTVELHLSAAYRKLGIRSRRDLPAALARA